MPTQPDYIQLTPNEDFHSVRDRLSFIRSKRVLFIWPEEGTALTRKLDLVLVQREAKRRAIQMALVTHDARVIEHARDLGISTFETVGASERARWKRGYSRLFTSREDRPEDAPEPEALMPVASRVRRPRARASAVLRLLVLFSAFAIIAGVAYVVLPSAVITLQLRQELLQSDIQIIADPSARDVDVDQKLIPATVLRATVQTVGSINTTGTQRLTDSPAIGVVVFTNQTNSPVEIPLNTTVSTSAGTPLLFKTVAAATVSAGEGERVEVAIEALQSAIGDVGNVDAGLINTVVGPLDRQVTVRNLSPTTGGETRVFASVTADDMDRLLALVRGNLQAAAYTQMQAQIGASQLIVIETIRIPPDGERQDWTTFSHEIGALTDTLTLDMRAVVEAIAIDDRFARQIVFADLSGRKPPELLLLPDTFQYTRGGVIEIQAGNRVVFSAGGQALLTGTLDTTTLQNQLAGLTPADALHVLTQRVSLMPNTAPAIRIEPAGMPTLPLLPFRIELRAEAAP